MTRALMLLSLTLYSGIAYAESSHTQRIPDPRVVVIFADVTSSLTVDQNKRVAKLTKDVIVHLRPLTDYRVYLIQADPDEEPIDQGTIRSATGPRDEKKRAEELCRRADADVDKIERRYCEINVGRGESICREKNVLPRPQPDHRSCILEVVEHVARSFLREEEHHPIDLVFISDMVEDCDDTPLRGASIRLIKDDLSADISNIDRFRKLEPITSQVRVTIVRPHVRKGLIESSARKLNLETYWKAAFVRFGVDINAWWRFESDLPKRFLPDVPGIPTFSNADEEDPRMERCGQETTARH